MKQFKQLISMRNIQQYRKGNAFIGEVLTKAILKNVAAVEQQRNRGCCKCVTPLFTAFEDQDPEPRYAKIFSHDKLEDENNVFVIQSYILCQKCSEDHEVHFTR